VPVQEITVPVQFPFCIVWTPIPIISWLLPFVGHMGICTSKGITLDFAGPYFISVDNLAFGNPSRYVFKLHGFKSRYPSAFCKLPYQKGSMESSYWSTGNVWVN
jgi:hypothetical protein